MYCVGDASLLHSTKSFNKEESEKVGELKSITGSAKLPYGTLALGTEGIKDAISGFDDAYVSPSPNSSADPRLDGNRISKTNACRRNCLTQTK
jgi:hypothetical protein